MRTKLSEIKAFSECPAYFKFLQALPKKPLSSNLFIAGEVIKKCYASSLEYGFKVDWRRIIGFVDTFVFKDVDVTDQKEFDAAKLIAEHILIFLRHWYNDVYLTEQVMGYGGLKIERQCGSHIIEDELFVVKVSNGIPVIMILNNVAHPMWELYNDISIRGLCWLAAETLECDNIDIEHMVIGKYGAYDLTTFSVNNIMQKRTKKVLYSIVQSMAAGISYPSRTEKCNQCPFLRRCKL